MPRIVAALALAAGLLLAAAFASAFLGSGAWHETLGWMAAGAAAGVHGLSALALAWWGRRIVARSVGLGLPTRVEAQAERNRGKALACQALGLGTIALAAWSAWACPGPWHRGLTALALGFQPGAFVAEAVMVAAQGRLAREVDAMAGEV